MRSFELLWQTLTVMEIWILLSAILEIGGGECYDTACRFLKSISLDDLFNCL